MEIFKQITIEALVNAPLEKAWDCYTNPEHIVHWNFAADSWCCPNAENDLRVGGKYKARMEAKDGSFGFDFEGIYEAVESPNYLCYVLADKRKVKVWFEPSETYTNVKVLFDAENENPMEMQQGGWQAILDNFKKYAEK